MAPGAAIQIYYLSTQNANAAGWASIARAVTMAQSNGARTISMSFGVCGPSRGYTVLQSALAAAFKNGVTTFVSSGDDGALAGPARQCGNAPGVGYPASDPSVVAVGGTSVRLAVDNSLAMETAWSLSGGGNGKPFLRPSWQVASTLGHGRYRYAPDVAFIGNPSTGAAIIYRGRWAAVGGTSLGAPAWAGIWSLVEADAAQNGKTLSAAPPLLYRIGNSAAYTQAFNDVTTGTNGRYTAHAGWDAVTGWGTPNVQGLITAVEAIS
jgi:subtilase family serine protease